MFKKNGLAQIDMYVFWVSSFGPLARPSSDPHNVNSLAKKTIQKLDTFTWDRGLIPFTNTS